MELNERYDFHLWNALIASQQPYTEQEFPELEIDLKVSAYKKERERERERSSTSPPLHCCTKNKDTNPPYDWWWCMMWWAWYLYRHRYVLPCMFMYVYLLCTLHVCTYLSAVRARGGAAVPRRKRRDSDARKSVTVIIIMIAIINSRCELRETHWSVLLKPDRSPLIMQIAREMMALLCDDRAAIAFAITCILSRHVIIFLDRSRTNHGEAVQCALSTIWSSFA